jgi:glycosyltransferase involved in cell wall biosynthesis
VTAAGQHTDDVGIPRTSKALAHTTSLTASVIVCAHNEAKSLPACLHSVLAQTRQPQQILVVNNASTDDTREVAEEILGVFVVDEPRRGLVGARETGRRHAVGQVLVYLDADCRAPIDWLDRVLRRFERDEGLIALSAPYRFYDWHWRGRALLRAYDLIVAPATQLLVKHVLRRGSVFYGGNFAVRREELAAIGGFDTSIEFHGEDTNLGRRLNEIGKVCLVPECWLYTSARRYKAMGTSAVIRLYVRNFLSEILRHRPEDVSHVDVRL